MRLIARRSRLSRYAASDHATGMFASSSSACVLAPFEGHGTLGARGVPIGPVLSGAGLFCYDPWELYADQARFGVTDPDMVVLGAKGQGKALDIDTPIPTPTGWTNMGDLCVGDYVIDHHGRPTEVIATTEAMLDHDCFEVQLSDGTTIIADAEHLWRSEAYMSHADKGRSTISVSTREMADTLLAWGGQKRHAIRLAEPLMLPEQDDLPVPHACLVCG